MQTPAHRDEKHSAKTLRIRHLIDHIDRLIIQHEFAESCAHIAESAALARKDEPARLAAHRLAKRALRRQRILRARWSRVAAEEARLISH